MPVLDQQNIIDINSITTKWGRVELIPTLNGIRVIAVTRKEVKRVNSKRKEPK